MVALPVWGAVADRLTSTVGALRLSCALAAGASLALLAAGSSLPLILISASLLAAARAPGEALSDTLTVATLRRSGRAAYGEVRLWSSVGFAAAVAIWAAVLDHVGLAAILLTYPLALLAQLGSTLAGSWPTGGRDPRPPARQRASAGRFRRRIGGLPRVGRRFPVFLGGVLLFGVAMGASSTALPLRITDLGGGLGLVGAAAVVGALAEIPFMRASGALHRVLGTRVLVLGGLVYAGSLVWYAALRHPAGLVSVSVLRGTGYAMVYVGLVTGASVILAPGRWATGQTLLQASLMGLGPIAGAPLAGLIYEHSPALLFVGASVAGLAGAVLAAAAVGTARAPGRVQPPRPETPGSAPDTEHSTSRREG
ncbi:hypothetical protein DLJ46_23760 [Micromonospora globispora]|uniref:Major facilitator superfamily associated domain-containing protein n=1 Tax=Micromonospora globispora TaxID=1450148 RepID=A0A317JVR2_9ACTN|nr:hypothetical protein DLJ46_23760 [Micromonospora globispora]